MNSGDRRNADGAPVAGGTPRQVTLACDKFKGSLTARDVSNHLATALRAAVPGIFIRSVPVADGGDGTVEAVIASGFIRAAVDVAGPTGQSVRASFAVDGRRAVVELADACGLVRLPQGRLAPLEASSRGVGQVIAAALDSGYRDIVLAVGGSASTDGGAGMVAALGARLLATDGSRVPDGAAGLAQIAKVDLGQMHPGLANARIVVASDVDNPLLGSDGAAAIYGPQKGVGPELFDQVEAGMANWAHRVAEATGRDLRDEPGAGAAGGVGFGALAVLGASLRPGIDLLAEIVGLDEAIAGSDLVITGEGSLDRQTLAGKAPAGVANRANAAGVPVVAVCGRSLLGEDEARAAGFSGVYALTDIEADTERCMSDAGALLERLAGVVAQQWLGAGE